VDEVAAPVEEADLGIFVEDMAWESLEDFGLPFGAIEVGDSMPGESHDCKIFSIEVDIPVALDPDAEPDAALTEAVGGGQI
jgi:hypothetical protein